MVLGICVEESPNHPLILRVVFLRLSLEEFDTALAQGDRDFYSFVLKGKILRPGQEVSDDLGVSQRFVRVFYFRAHRFVFLSANSLRRIFELLRHDR